MPADRPRLAIACQGGGSHTAFTAGVLECLLAAGIDSEYQITGLSGTSGGGICALLVWYDLLRRAAGHDDPLGARLIQFWADNSAALAWERQWNRLFIQYRRLENRGWYPAFSVDAGTLESLGGLWKTLAPRPEFFDLRTLVEKHVDFAALPRLVTRDSPVLLLGAVDVQDGTFKAFDSQRGEISAAAALASAAVPSLFRPVRVGQRDYWDGLFAENPPVLSLAREALPHELWVTAINPTERKTAPASPEAVIDRTNELAGNISLQKAKLVIRMFNRWVREGAFRPEWLAAHSAGPIAFEKIQMDCQLAERLDYASKLDRDPGFLRELVEEGRRAAERFLARRKPRPDQPA